MFFSVYRGFRLLWIPVIISLLFLSGVSDYLTDMSKRDISTRKYEEKRLYEVCESVFRLKITAASTQPIAHSEKGGEEPAM